MYIRTTSLSLKLTNNKKNINTHWEQKHCRKRGWGYTEARYCITSQYFTEIKPTRRSGDRHTPWQRSKGKKNVAPAAYPSLPKSLASPLIGCRCDDLWCAAKVEDGEWWGSGSGLSTKSWIMRRALSKSATSSRAPSPPSAPYPLFSAIFLLHLLLLFLLFCHLFPPPPSGASLHL